MRMATRRNAASATAVSFLLLALVAAPAHAGPINPPAGPVASTPGPEPRIPLSLTTTPGDANSVFKITQPGSYYLTGNLTGSSAKHGIEIGASGVVIDLMGYSLIGVAGSLDGVNAPFGTYSGVTVRNGSVSSWGGGGVALAGIAGTVIEGVHAFNNGSIGISGGSHATVSNCTANQNGSVGISVTTDSSVSECHAGDNEMGFLLTLGCVATSCTADDNNSHGFFGNSAGTGGLTFDRCTATSNGGHGFSIISRGTVLRGCIASSNGKNGYDLGSGCRITDSTAESNIENGFFLNTGCHISGCSARINDLDGIRASGGCVIRDNLCISNGQTNLGGVVGAGIHTTGTDNRIEGNNCTTNDRGIDVDSSASIIFRNTCSGNSLNWTFAANNVFGPIIDRTLPASGSVSGNSAADASGSTHPNANFTY